MIHKKKQKQKRKRLKNSIKIEEIHQKDFIEHNNLPFERLIHTIKNYFLEIEYSHADAFFYSVVLVPLQHFSWNSIKFVLNSLFDSFTVFGKVVYITVGKLSLVTRSFL